MRYELPLPIRAYPVNSWRCCQPTHQPNEMKPAHTPSTQTGTRRQHARKTIPTPAKHAAPHPADKRSQQGHAGKEKLPLLDGDAVGKAGDRKRAMSTRWKLHTRNCFRMIFVILWARTVPIATKTLNNDLSPNSWCCELSSVKLLDSSCFPLCCVATGPFLLRINFKYRCPIWRCSNYAIGNKIVAVHKASLTVTAATRIVSMLESQPNRHVEFPETSFSTMTDYRYTLNSRRRIFRKEKGT